MSKTESSLSPSLSKYPQPLYKDYDLHYIPKLNYYNVNYWKLTMSDYIEGNGLIGFINGSIIPPPLMINDDIEQPLKWNVNPDYMQFKQVDDQACVEGNMKDLQEILNKSPNVVRDVITGACETALMVACHRNMNTKFVEKLISLMSPQDLAMQSSFGRTAMFGAAVVGNVEAMKMMVEKNHDLPNMSDLYNQLPIHCAAMAGEKHSVHYLLEVTGKEFIESKRLTLVHSFISGGFYDICLSLLQRYPELAVLEVSPLETLTYRHSAFLSGTNFSFWQQKIYSYLPDSDQERPIDHFSNNIYDVENPANEVEKVSMTKTKWSSMFWQIIGNFFPEIKHIQKKKVMHTQALQLLRFICSEIAKLDSKMVRDLIGQPLQAAAIMGNVEVVEEILISFPNAIYLVNMNKFGVFQIAIANRKANVFNLLYQITTQRHLLLTQRDALYNTSLHLAANLVGGTDDEASLDLRSSAPGAALQLQRELQWFKVVKELSWPQDQEQRNMLGKTPATVFTETHENLAREGEQWMKDRANSGIIVATLIATIVFTSAITVPGGSNGNNGLPIFSNKQAFIVFAVSDALALFMSASSMLMFLGILTARYAVQDFLYSLPKRLIIALITLFLSIIFMMISFTSILYLVFGDEKRWVLGLVSSLATIPVLLFALMQFNPLLDIISSTYGPGIFGIIYKSEY
ncbi:hypothetical protein E3N88_13371 [Mikania micrantha]|uniref:PGG domain-containing protein n=1 Tax=Mikania micrantha TaxID=192012 RepID=A0A5N6PA09_9ASTR|nr:hypothetical protein E3N88_13371 [Mikania micrantha]